MARVIFVDSGSEYEEMLRAVYKSGHMMVGGEIVKFSVEKAFAPYHPPPPAPRSPRLRGSMSEMMERLNRG